MASDSTPFEHQHTHTPRWKLQGLGIPSILSGCCELKPQKGQYGVMLRSFDWVPDCVISDSSFSTYLLGDLA